MHLISHAIFWQKVLNKDSGKCHFFIFTQFCIFCTIIRVCFTRRVVFTKRHLHKPETFYNYGCFRNWYWFLEFNRPTLKLKSRVAQCQSSAAYWIIPKSHNILRLPLVKTYLLFDIDSFQEIFSARIVNKKGYQKPLQCFFWKNKASTSTEIKHRNFCFTQ